MAMPQCLGSRYTLAEASCMTVAQRKQRCEADIVRALDAVGFAQRLLDKYPNEGLYCWFGYPCFS
jgi:hypothetical protein